MGKLVIITALVVSCSRGGDVSTVSQSVEMPWSMHTIASGYNGADGVDLADLNGDGFKDVATGWEGGGNATVSLNPGPLLAGSPWPTVKVNSSPLYGLEDAIIADVDVDGHPDVISAGESNKRITIHFAPSDFADVLNATKWLSVTVSASVNVQRYMKSAWVDIDGNGSGDIVVGGKVMPATVGYYSSATPRVGSSWVYTTISPASWIMSILPTDLDGDGDLDLVVTDKDYIHTSPPDYTYIGTRWLENLGALGWVNHTIYQGGSHRFARLHDLDSDGDLDIVGGRATPADELVKHINLGDGAAWASTLSAAPADFGDYQGNAVGDIDLDGDIDFALSGQADGLESGIVWIDSAGVRHEVSGTLGAKFDNLELIDLDADGDLDIVTSEETDQLGVIFYENPYAVAAPDAGPDATVCLCPCECPP